MDPKTSMIDSVSLEQTFVHQKQNNKIHLSFTSCKLLFLFSKHLSFLSLHIVHQILAGIILHLSLFVAPTPAISQLNRVSSILLGIHQDMPLRLRKIYHSCSVKLQCKKRCLTVSLALPHKEHLLHREIPLLATLSNVKTALLASSHVKHATLCGTLFLQICFQGHLKS